MLMALLAERIILELIIAISAQEWLHTDNTDNTDFGTDWYIQI